MTVTDSACQCAGTGYLLDQTYGEADIPEDWCPVQACDACKLAADDEEAAMYAANAVDDIDHRVYYAFFPGGVDEDNEPLLGDWAIGPNQ